MIRFLTIRTRLMIMLILVSILACAVLGFLSTKFGKRLITQEVTNQLTLVRNAKKSQIESYLGDISKFVEVMGQNSTVIDAADAFKNAFRQLGNSKLDAECSQALESHYHEYIDKLSENVDIKTDIDLFIPKTVEACYLQFEYIVNNTFPPGSKDLMAYAKDKSDYSNVHRKYHEFFRLMLNKFNFYDIFLIDLERGDVLYSVYKETDFATNLYSGPYRSSNLTSLAKNLNTNSDLQTALWQDFESYRPSYGAPAGFVGIPLTRNGETVGALVFQLPVDEINHIMTGDASWEQDGLGQTGETYLVGEDFRMRSISRFFLQDTVGYTKSLLTLGIQQSEIDKMYRFGTTILQQRIKSEGVLEAFDGISDTKVIKDYRGVNVISAYAPLNLNGLNWSILAEKDEEEAFLPAKQYNLRVFIQTIVLIILVTLLGMFMSAKFVQPIEQLSHGARKIIDGDTKHRFNISSKDEFGTLSDSFNKMVGTLDDQKTQIQNQVSEREKLLLNFVPPEIGKRIQKGEKAFADDYFNVSLIAIDLVGFSELSDDIGATESVSRLNEIVDAYDDCAARYAIRKIRTVGDTYFGECGLFEPRLDHAKRMIQFATEAKQLLDQFNLNHGMSLKIHVSVNSGNVMGGLIGSNRYSFDVWGKTVNMLFKMTELDIDNEILVSQEVVERLEGIFEFKKVHQTQMLDNEVYSLISS